MPIVLNSQGLLYQQPGEWSRILEAAGFEIRYPQPGGRMLTAAELIANLTDVDATIASGEPYTTAVFEAAPRLRVISRTGVGYDAIDFSQANRRGVLVGVTPGVNYEAVAEQAFALILAVVKQIIPNHLNVVGGGFLRGVPDSLRGKTLGLVGMGRIGRSMERRARAFEMRVLATDPRFAPGVRENGTRVVTFDTLLAQSDIVSLHAPMLADTRHLIRAETIARMKTGAILINTARGGLVDEPALAAALASGKLAAAGLDVFECEPPLDCPLLAAPHVALSPHVAGVDRQSLADMATMAAQTIVDIFSGRLPTDRLVNAAEAMPNWNFSPR